MASLLRRNPFICCKNGIVWFQIKQFKENSYSFKENLLINSHITLPVARCILNFNVCCFKHSNDLLINQSTVNSFYNYRTSMALQIHISEFRHSYKLKIYQYTGFHIKMCSVLWKILYPRE